MKQLHISIVRDKYKMSIWGKVKMLVWNFILPPHIWFDYAEPDTKKGKQ